MRFISLSIEHQTAPVEVREKVAISSDKLMDALSMLYALIPQGVILSTCNRTEIYTTDEGHTDGVKASLEFLTTRLNTSDVGLLQHARIFRDEEVIQHLFRLASGLESMIVGEFEVLGQMRKALDAAEKAGMVNLALRQIFQSAIRTGRRVRDETGLSKNAVSVSSVALDLAIRTLGDLKNSRMLVIGTGEAGKLVARVAKERGTTQMIIASRTPERAKELAEKLGATPVGMDNLVDEIKKVNIIVTCTGSPQQVLDHHKVSQAMKQRPDSPLLIIDIAVPRNVAPNVGGIKNVFLYDIDDLTRVTEINRKQRESEIQAATGIIKQETGEFLSWWKDYEVRPLIGALMSKAEEIRASQLSLTIKKLPPLTSEQQESLESMTKSIIIKILKDPINYIKENGDNGHSSLVKEVFKLDTEKTS